MMQESYGVEPATESGLQVHLTAQGLAALLAGSRRLEMGQLGSKMRLTSGGTHALVAWLQRERLVDLVSSLDGDDDREAIVLTDRGESVLLGLLEQMCELPEFR
jgi:hypothetical protein